MTIWAYMDADHFERLQNAAGHWEHTKFCVGERSHTVAISRTYAIRVMRMWASLPESDIDLLTVHMCRPHTHDIPTQLRVWTGKHDLDRITWSYPPMPLP